MEEKLNEMKFDPHMTNFWQKMRIIKIGRKAKSKKRWIFL